MAFESAATAGSMASPNGPVDFFFSQDVSDDVFQLSAEDTDLFTLLPPDAPLPRALMLRLDDADGRPRWAEAREFQDERNWVLLHPGALDLIRARYLGGDQRREHMEMVEPEEELQQSLGDPIEAEEFNKEIQLDPLEYAQPQAEYELFGDSRIGYDSRLPRDEYQDPDLAMFDAGLNAGEDDEGALLPSNSEEAREGDDRAQTVNPAELSETRKRKMAVTQQSARQPTSSLAAPNSSLAASIPSLAASVSSLATPTPSLVAPIPSLAAPTSSLVAPTSSLAAPTLSLPQSIPLNAQTPPYLGIRTIPADILAMCGRIRARISPTQMPSRSWLGKTMSDPTGEFVTGGFIGDKSRLWEFWMDLRLFEGRVWWWLATRDNKPFPKVVNGQRNPTAQVQPGSIQAPLNRMVPGWDPTRIYTAPYVAPPATNAAPPGTSSTSSAGPAASSGRAAKRRRTS